MITINIGLERSSNQALIPVADALATVTQHMGQPQRFALVESDTEPTLVAEFAESDTLRFLDLETLAVELDQDCIATLHDGDGFLVGPRAAKWGRFNPEFFICLDGTRLGAAVHA